MSSKDYGEPFRETATHATSAVASHTGVAGKTFYITDIVASSDKAEAILLVKDGTTVIWQVQVGDAGTTNTDHYEQSFVVPLRCTKGNLASVTIDGTAACKSNIAGYEI